jgi:membrane protein YqaA with SNARE-associated domain
MESLAELLFLFVSAFFAATIIPAQSEAVLVGLYLTGKNNILVLLTIATIGNVLGSFVNWFLGRYLIHFKDKSWFPIKNTLIHKATGFYQKYGVWTLLLAWLPIIGDPLTLIAGVFRINIVLFLMLVTIGKAARYLVLLMII